MGANNMVLICLVIIFVFQSICPILANLNTDGMKNKDSEITIKSRYNTRLNNEQYYLYYAFAGYAVFVITDLFILMIAVSVGFKLKLSFLVFVITAIILLIIVFVLLIGVNTFLYVNKYGKEIFLKEHLNCGSFLSKISSVYYTMIVTRLHYKEIPKINLIDGKNNIWNGYFISIFIVQISLIIIFVLKYFFKLVC